MRRRAEANQKAKSNGDFDRLLQRLADAWCNSSIRPRLDSEVLQTWDRLIEEWIEAQDIPLLIRKSESAAGRGWVIRHNTGRELVPTDNTPANWGLTLALAGTCPSLENVRGPVAENALPVAMALKKKEREGARFKGTRAAFADLNSLGWKVCHKAHVALRGQGSMTGYRIDVLQNHFRRFLAPSNMFLVPKRLAGLGELPHMVSAMRNRD